MGKRGKMVNKSITLTYIPPKIRIEDLRAKHLENTIQVEGRLIHASDIRPQAVRAKFECPACKTRIQVLQVTNKFKEPSMCPCGRKKNFKLISKELTDAQKIVIEDLQEKLKKEQSKISVYLHDNLTCPELRTANKIGSIIEVVGKLLEVPIYLESGETSVHFDFAIQADGIKFMEEK